MLHLFRSIMFLGLVLMVALPAGPHARAQDTKVRAKIEIVPNIPHVSVRSVAFSPDGRQVLSGSWDKTIKLWDPATGALLRTFVGHSSGIDAVAFPGNDKDYATIERVQLRGPLVALFSGSRVVDTGLVEEAVSFVRRNTTQSPF